MAVQDKDKLVSLEDLKTAYDDLNDGLDEVKNTLNHKADAIYDTASGDIASFPDGADGLPVKDLTVAIEPVQDLHGYDNPWPAGGGKNHFQMIDTDVSSNDIVVTANDDGTINISGTASADTSIALGKNTNELNALFALGGTFAFSLHNCTYNAQTFNVSVQYKESGSGQVKYLIPGNTVTLNPGAAFIRANLWVDSGKTVTTASHFAIQIETGSITTFAPYSNICPISGWTGANVKRTGKNIATTSVYKENYVLSSSGDEVNASGYIITDTTKIGGNQTYTISFKRADLTNIDPIRLGFYDTYGSFIERREYVNSPSYFQAPNNAAFIRMSYFAAIGYPAYIYDIQIEPGSTATTYEPYSGTTLPISWQTEAGTVYGGTLDVTSGVLTVTDANIASYNGETLPGEWISDRDVYAAGTMPTTGAQVVYKLAQPQTYQLDSVTVTTLLGQNNVWSDTGSSTVEYPADTKLYIDKKLAALVAALS